MIRAQQTSADTPGLAGSLAKLSTLQRIAGDPAAALATARRAWSHVDGTPRICELVRYHMVDINLIGAWTAPAALELNPHALAPVADLPVLKVESAVHYIADMTLALGTVEHDYLA